MKLISFPLGQQPLESTNPNAARSTGDPWPDWSDIPDHWDAESVA
jgi:hypothetical protein